MDGGGVAGCSEADERRSLALRRQWRRRQSSSSSGRQTLGGNVDIQDAVQVIDFVLKDARQPTRCRQPNRRSHRDSCPANSTLSWRSTSPSKPGSERQPSTPLTISSLRRMILGLASTYSLPASSRVLFAGCPRHRGQARQYNPQALRNLWSGKADALGIRHGIDHVINQTDCNWGPKSLMRAAGRRKSGLSGWMIDSTVIG